MADGWDVVPENPISEDEAQGVLQLASTAAGGTAPVRVTSGYRTPEHNAEIGGAANSLHTREHGQAVDFVLPPGADPNAVRAELERQGYPITEWLIEHAGDAHSTGPHIHWGWGPKGGGTAKDPWAVVGGSTPPPAQQGQGKGQDPWAVVPATGATPAAAPATKPQPMPNPLVAIVQGIVSSGKDVGQTFTGKRVADTSSPAAEPLHWADVLHPMDALSKVAYGFGASAPMMAGGVLGTGAGAAIPGAGETGVPEIVGGSLGASLGTTLQVLGPAYAQELQRTPKDPDGAFDRAIKATGLDAVSSGASWAAFAYAPFKNQIKNLLLQALAVQPGISMATKAVSNTQQGKPVSSDMEETYLQGAAGTLVPAAGHALASVALSRMGLHTQASIAAAKAKDEASRVEPTAAAVPQPQPNQDLLDMAAIPQPGRKEPVAAVPPAPTPTPEPERPFTTNPAKIANEHELEMAQVEADAAKAAKPGPKPDEPGSIVKGNPHLLAAQEAMDRAGIARERPALDDRQAWVDRANKALEAAQNAPAEDLEHLERIVSGSKAHIDSIDHEAQMERAEPVAEMALPKFKGTRSNTPIGRIEIMRDPETGKFGVGTHYDLSGFARGGVPVSGRQRLPFDFDSAQDALDYAKQRLQQNPANFGSGAGPRAIKESQALNQWLGGLQLPPTPEAPDAQKGTENITENITAAAPTAEPAPPSPPQGGVFKWKQIGQSPEGRTLFEDKNGVRSYVENGVRMTEPVQMRPTRGGMEIAVDRIAHPEFATTDEAAQVKPSLPPQVEPPPPPDHPKMIELAHAIAGYIKTSNKPITAKDLQTLAEDIYGGSLGSGAFGRDELYDAAELGINLFLRSYPSEGGHGPYSPAVDEKNAQMRAKALEVIKDRMPTQTVRAGEKETHQQFSTPPDYSYAGAWAANLHPTDVVLEPSAGTGSFVTHALNAGVREVHANELSDRRADMVRVLDPTNVTKENAEHIDIMLPDGVKPSVVLMNPPFSAAAKVKSKMVLEVGAKHVEAALKKLQPGGRLVAIVGRGMNPTAPTFRSWWSRIAKQYDVRANIGVEGGIYRKYGTTFPTRLLIIDKNAPSGRPVVKADGLKTAGEIIDALKEIRDDRVHTAGEQPVAEPAGEILAGPGEGGVEPGAAVSPPTGELGPSEGSGTARPDRIPSAGTAGGKSPRGKGKRGSGAKSIVPVADEQPQHGGAAGTGTDTGTAAAPVEEPDRSGSGGAGDGIVPDGSGQRVEPGVTPAPATVMVTEISLGSDAADAPITDAVYEPYKPQRVKITGAKEHPGALVQSAAMASVMPPAPKHNLALPEKVVKDGLLSDAQLEAVVYAGHAHGQIIPETGVAGSLGHMPQRRRGFFIGDGTGVGKGREVSGIILDNWERGGKKHVWVSEKQALLNDARRDWSGLGRDEKDVFSHNKVKPGDPIKQGQGILFTTYDTLKSAEKLKEKDEKTGNAAKGKTRVQQLIDWVGPDFDGVIAFDEAHNLGNSQDMKGNRGVKKAAAKALAGVELQNKLPNARVVYVSATGATEVSNLAYADRLGLWGRDTAFADRNDFLSKISKGGMAAMELVARDMKAMGRYIARSLSYDGVEYDRVEHTLTPQQHEIYNKLADAWQLVLRNFEAAMEKTGITETNDDTGRTKTKSANAKSAILSQFWGTHQRFFNQVITSLQMPTVLKAVERDIKEGRQAVLQLVNTNEAAQERALSKAKENEEDLEDLDMSPRDQLLQLVANAYPVTRFQEEEDENGNVRSVPVFDSNSNPVQDPELVAAREALLDELGSIRVPDGPLETLLNHFGPDKVSEVTGRKQRVVRLPDPKTGEMRTVVEKRPDSSNIVEADAFQRAKKPILVFSEAGGTGRSYHADINSESASKRRSHYLIQAGWRADKAVQGFGRTHRTNQASAPQFHLVTTDLQGQRRFISSIARRLAQLGALTKGERRTGDQGLFGLRDNLESQEAKEALKIFFNDAIAGRIPGIGLDDLQNQMGLKLIDDNGRELEKQPDMTRFLNRLLSLRTDTQNQVFNEFSKRMDDAIDRAAAAGTLDTGVETRRADKIVKRGDQVIYRDPESGAETRHVHLETWDKLHPAKYADVVTRLRKKNASGDAGFIRSVRSGKLFGVHDATPRTDTTTGQIFDQKRLIGPLDYQFVDAHKLDDDRYWTPIDDPSQQSALWDEQVSKLPEYAKEDLHLITGAVLPIWDRLSGDPRIYRLQTDTGEKMLGRVISNDSVNDTLTALGAKGVQVDKSPSEVASSILDENKTAVLANGWKIKRRLVAGEPRLELVGPDYNYTAQLKQDGVFTERINYDTRYFIPTGERAAEVIASVIKNRPITSLAAAPKETSQHQRMEGERAVHPPFFSALTRAIDEVKLTRAPAKDWLGLIGNLAQKGVKQEEIDWSGVKDWLLAQTGAVTKDQVLQHLRENEVQVQEVVKGGTSLEQQQARLTQEYMRWTAKNGFPLDVSADDLAVTPGITDEQREYLRDFSARWEGAHSEPTADDRNTLMHEIKKYVHSGYLSLDQAMGLYRGITGGHSKEIGEAEGLGVPDEAIAPFRDQGGGPTKFGTGQGRPLPGGQNYRELLLTLPLADQSAERAALIAEREKTAQEGKYIVGHPEHEAAMSRYHEITRRLNDIGPDNGAFRGGHWDEPNVLAHVRFDDRTGPNGEKILHLAEVQSDWHQKGRKGGYKAAEPDLKPLRDKLEEARNAYTKASATIISRVTGGNYHSLREVLDSASPMDVRAIDTAKKTDPDFLAAAERYAVAKRAMDEAETASLRAVPNAPFKASWHELALKRMLRYAAEHGYDKLTWDTGETNADRYDLSHSVDALHVMKGSGKSEGQLRVFGKKDGRTVVHQDTTPEKLADYIGKDAAEKAIEKLKTTNEAVLSGQDLKVGGAGMRAFYDKILPAFLNKYGKKWGAKVTGSKIAGSAARYEFLPAHGGGFDVVDRTTGRAVHSGSDPVELHRWVSEHAEATPAHSIDITPAMRDSVLKGQPLFRREALQGNPQYDRALPVSSDIKADLGGGHMSPEEQAVIDRVSALARQMIPKADVIAARAIFAQREGMPESRVSGATILNGIRRMILWSLEAPDAIGTVRHEAIHWLRHNGFFTGAEWHAMERAARAGDWMGRWKILERYPDLPFESQLEEAIAEQFAYWRRGRGVPEIVRPLFERLAQMLGWVRDYLRQQFGHDTHAENIFQRIQSGEIGSRTAASMVTPTGPAFGKRGLQQMDRTLFQKMDPDEREGRVVEAARSLINLGEDFQMLMAPMARGSDMARATVKDFLNLIRAGRDYGQFRVRQTLKAFSPEERRRMYRAADEESILRQQGVSDLRDRGLAKLDPKERAWVDTDQNDAQSVWKAMVKAGQVEGEGIPSYVPHLYVEVGEQGYRRLGSNQSVKSIPGMGRNVTTTSPHLKHRKYLTPEEGAAAASERFGVHAKVLDDIATLPLATMRNRMALAGYQLIQTIKTLGKGVGEDWVAEGATPPGFFHIDHPSFFRWRLKMVTNPETGKVEPATDQAGHKVFDKIPLSVHGAWEGPLRAGLTQESSAAYRAFMDLKMRAMTNIMFSPFVQLHFLTELGRAFPAAPLKILTTKLLMEGFQAKQDPATRLRAVMAGLVPVGRHGAMQDISSVTEGQSLVPGRSWTSQILAAVPGLFSRSAGEAVKRGVDRIGDLLHGTLLWDRVEDLQFGLFGTLSDFAREKGLSPQTADRYAAHAANRFAGTLPQESMSTFARKLSNILLFSRTYTLGNLGMFKDALGGMAGALTNLTVGKASGREIGKSWGGMPLDIQAQIKRDAPEELAKVQSMARRKAISMLAVDVALMYGLSSAIQSFIAWMNGESGEDLYKGYVARWQQLEEDVKKDPFLIANPFYAMLKLSPLSENEMDPATGMPLQRIFLGYDKEGTAIYARNPAGKYAEEIVNWTTAPLATLKSKLNALGVRPTLDVMNNDKGFGRKIWLPTDNAAQILGKVAAHYMESVVPTNQISALRDLLEGKTKGLDVQQLAGRTVGVTFRHGAPGGPAVGLMYRVRDEHEALLRDEMPNIMQQIKDGEIGPARQRMTALGLRPRLQIWYIRVARNPRLRLSPHAMRDFMREASPVERAQMQRLRGAGQ